MIIVDDCSSDDTVIKVKKCIRSYPKLKIYLIENKTNLGPAKTRNKAIEKANGRFIAFLDTDDLWEPKKLEHQINFMLINRHEFTCTYYDLINEEGKLVSSKQEIPQKISYETLLKSNKIGCLTAIYDTAYFGKVFMNNIAKRQDYGLWLELLRKVDYAYCYPEVLAKYRVRKNSVSSNKIKLIKYHWIIYKEQENLGYFKSIILTFGYVYRTLLSKVNLS
jgi:glycosyltransferase involved in cell wall biosynthesis